MKKLPVKKIIQISLNKIKNDFNLFLNVSTVPFIIILPFYLYSYYYDEFVLDLFNKKGMISFIRGSHVTKLVDYLIVFPLTSAFLANWHRYVLFNGKRPWKFIPLDFSKYTFQFIWAAIKVGLIFIIPAIAFMALVVWLSFNLFGIGFLYVGIVFYIVVAVVYFVRIALIFPATAAEENNSMKRIFKLTKNSFWQLLLINISFIGLVLCFLIVHFVLEMIYPSTGSIITTLIYAGFTLFYIFIAYGYLATCLSESYKYLRK